MAKYYIHSGSYSVIYSTMQSPLMAAIAALYDTNEHDVLDEYVYVDERGMRNETTRDIKTFKISTERLLELGMGPDDMPPYME